MDFKRSLNHKCTEQPKFKDETNHKKKSKAKQITSNQKHGKIISNFSNCHELKSSPQEKQNKTKITERNKQTN